MPEPIISPLTGILEFACCAGAGTGGGGGGGDGSTTTHSEEFFVDGTFHVPLGIGTVSISEVAGGGGGAIVGVAASGGGGGGSGEARKSVPLSVTPLQSLPVVVGLGGLGATVIGAGGNGGSSSVSNGTTTIIAGGGLGGGTSGVTRSSGAGGGTGGSPSVSSGDGLPGVLETMDAFGGASGGAGGATTGAAGGRGGNNVGFSTGAAGGASVSSKAGGGGGGNSVYGVGGIGGDGNSSGGIPSSTAYGAGGGGGGGQVVGGQIVIAWEDHTTHAVDWRWAFRWTEGRVGLSAPRIDAWTYPNTGIVVTTAPYRPVTGGGNYPDVTDLNVGALGMPVGNYLYSNGSSTPLWVSSPSPAVGDLVVSGGHVDAIVSGYANSVGAQLIGGTAWAHNAGIPDGLHVSGTILSNDRKTLLVLCSSNVWYKIINGVVASSGTVAAGALLGTFGPGGVLVTYQCAVLEDNGRYVWLMDSNDSRGMTVPGHGINSPGAVTLYWINDSGVFDIVSTAGFCSTNDPGYDRTGFTPNWSGIIYSAVCSPKEGYCGVVIGISMVLFSRNPVTVAGGDGKSGYVLVEWVS